MTAPTPNAEIEASSSPRHAADEEAPAKPRGRKWRVVSQRAERRDVTVCWHRWEWTAELHAHWLSGRGSHQVTGTFYTVYPAEEGRDV